MTSSANGLFRRSWSSVKEGRTIDKPIRAGETILLVDPLDKQILNAISLGWTVEVLFIGQFWREVPEGIKVYHLGCDAQALDFSPNTTYHTIWADNILSVYYEDFTFISRFLKLLKPNAKLVLIAKNAKYYQNLIDRASRDLGPWPHHGHKGVEYFEQKLKTKLLEVSSSVVFKALEDENMSHPNFEKWAQVDGSDCDVVLSKLSLAERKQTFTSGWVIEIQDSKVTQTETSKNETILQLMQKENLKSSQSSHFMQTDDTQVGNSNAETSQVECRDRELEAIFYDVEERLQKGDIDFVDALLTDAASRKANDSRIFNYRGVLNFYKNDNLNAYLCFIDAIEKYDNRQDYWENLWDAAVLIGRCEDVLFLANTRKSQLGFLAGLILDWQQSINN